MVKERKYKLEDIKFEGRGYKSIHPRKVCKSATSGLIHVPAWLIGEEVEFIIIPKIPECKHDWDKSILLLSNPAQERCKKCGATRYIGVDFAKEEVTNEIK